MSDQKLKIQGEGFVPRNKEADRRKGADGKQLRETTREYKGCSRALSLSVG